MMGTAPEFEPGARIGDLRIESVLGQGAFGTVYRARDVKLDRHVALKVCAVPPSHAAIEDSDRAWTEARFTAKFEHENIVRLYRVRTIADGWVGYEMEYVAGGTLADMVQEQRLPGASRAVTLARGITAAVRAAHEANVVHGDIKPSNILIREDGRPKLSDFGLARAHRTEGDEAAQYGPGTPLYMAPEVLMGGPTTPSSDVWSLGLTLFELFTGEYAFESTGFQSLFFSIQNESPRYEECDLPPLIEGAVRQCLSKDPSQRPHAADIDQLLRGSSQPTRAPTKLPDGLPELAGRQDVLSFLTESFERRASGEPQVVLLNGEPGIGKSAVARAHGSQLHARGVPVLMVQDWSRRGLVSAILRAVGKELQSSSPWKETPSSRRTLRSFLSDDVQQLESRGQLVDAARHALDILAAPYGACLIVENIHLASRDDARFMAGLVRRCADLPISIVMTCRIPGRSGVLGDMLDAQHVDEIRRDLDPEVHVLSPLEDGEIVQLVGARHHAMGPEVRHRIVSGAEGNPLLALELYRYLFETGAIEIRDDIVKPGRAWSDPRAPQRVHGLVLARIKRLSRDEQELIDVAAVAGRSFAPDLVAETLERPLLSALRQMQALFRNTGILVPADQGFRFSHALIHQAVLDDLAPLLKRELSLRMARILETREELDDALVGQLWHEGGEQERARPFLLRAANAAERLQENHRAVALFERAGLSARPQSELDPAEHAEDLLALAACYSDLGRDDDALSIFRLLHETARRDGSTALEHRVRAREARFLFYRDGRSGIDVDALRAAVEALPAGKSRACGYYGLGLAMKRPETLDEAYEHFKSAYRDNRQLNRLSGTSDALDQLGTVAKRRGRFRRAARFYRYAAEHSERAGRRINASVSRFNEALTQFRTGNFAGVTGLLRSCIEVFGSEGATKLCAHALAMLADVHWAEGDGDQALKCLDRAELQLGGQRYLPAERSIAFRRAQWSAIRGESGAAAELLARAKVLAERDEETRFARAIDVLEILVRALCHDEDGAAAQADRIVRDHESEWTVDDANELVMTLALAERAGADARSWPRIARVRRAADDWARAARIAVRLQITGSKSARARDAVLTLLLHSRNSFHRAYLRMLAFAIRDQAGDGTAARRIAEQLGLRLAPERHPDVA